MRKKFDLADGIALLSFVGLIFLDRFLFERIWGVGYWEWYLHNGAQMSWLMALLTLIWGDFNDNTALISARPLEYLMGYTRLLAVVFNSLAPLGKTVSTPTGPVTSYRAIDGLLAILLAFVFTVFILAWVIVVVPVQYFVFLICGAPARVMTHSKERPVARLAGGLLETGVIECDKDVPEGWWDTSVAQKPVSLTAGFAGMFIWLLQAII